MSILDKVTPQPSADELNALGLTSISQTLIKEWWNYWAAETCGLYFDAVYIKKTVKTETTEAMNLGKYFEYKATGQTDRDGEIPKPRTIQTLNKVGEAKKAEWVKQKILVKDMQFDADDYELAAPYKVAEAQASLLNTAYKIYGYEIIDTGTVLWHKTDEYFTKGILDSIGIMNGNLIIRDTKFTALLNNKWEEHGWHIDKMKYNKKHLIQAIHYKFLAWKMLDVWNIPFYFDVYSSTTIGDAQCYQMEIRDEDFLKTMQDHEEFLIYLQQQIKFQESVGYEAIPEMLRCYECPLRQECDKKTLVAIPKEITIK